MITVDEFFDDDNFTLRATFSVCPMAEAIGCDPEHASQFAGQYDMELHECICVETGAEHEPTPFQLEWLQQAALKEVTCYRR